jgi:DNA-binding NarL/FixJ family response regulator
MDSLQMNRQQKIAFAERVLADVEKAKLSLSCLTKRQREVLEASENGLSTIS